MAFARTCTNVQFHTWQKTRDFIPNSFSNFMLFQIQKHTNLWPWAYLWRLYTYVCVYVYICMYMIIYHFVCRINVSYIWFNSGSYAMNSLITENITMTWNGVKLSWIDWSIPTEATFKGYYNLKYCSKYRTYLQ